jgi:predicted  nucleic acid-binding Zn-ribbon protein
MNNRAVEWLTRNINSFKNEIIASENAIKNIQNNIEIYEESIANCKKSIADYQELINLYEKDKEDKAAYERRLSEFTTTKSTNYGFED